MKRALRFLGCVLLSVFPLTVGGGRVDSAEGFQGIPAVGNYANMRVQADFGRMPVYFIPNGGQMDERVAYTVQGQDKTIYFTSEGITFALAAPSKPEDNRSGLDRMTLGPRVPGESASKGPEADERWVVKLDFVGADKGVRPVGEAETGAVVSYFRGGPDKWLPGLPTYSKVLYRGLWPGVDLIYYGTVNKLKYEFIVHPGADPSIIRLAYRGAESVSVDESGRLQVTTPAGGISDDVPVAYQEVDGERVDISLSYRLNESNGKRRRADTPEAGSETQGFAYGFEVGDYDHSLPLVLDPAILAYCGYIGGSSYDCGYGIAVDGAGNAYVTGFTHSTEATFPETVGPDLTQNGSDDAFVAKVNPSGTGLVYCGYIGGSGIDFGLDVAVDGAGNAYVTGHTDSSAATFPVTVGPDLTQNGATDAFVAKVNSSGTGLVYCGYIGGSNYDIGRGVAADASGNAYVTGYTYSTEATFPVTVGPDLTYNLSYDAFVAKVNSSGSGLVYCGYIGASSDDLGNGIGVDGSGNAYVTGYAGSDPSFPVTVGPDLTHNGGDDVFVAKVNSSGTGLVYCGYIGGADGDYAYGIGVDASGNAYVSGYTRSTEATFPVTVGPDLTYNGDIYDAFVAKVNSSGTGLAYCGYIGGSDEDYGYGIAVDGTGSAYVMGHTRSTEATFPVTVGPDLTHNLSDDVFVAKVNPSGAALVYCGYIGGASNDYGFGIAVDGTGNAYVTGLPNSNEYTFPVLVGPDVAHNGDNDAFVAKVSYWDVWASKHAVGDFDGDGADETAVDFGAAGIYLYNGGSWTQLSASNPESLVAGDVDGDSVAELLADLGTSGLWLWNAGAWNQLSGVNVEGMAAGDVDADGADEVVGDFGTVGMWLYNGGAWTQLSGVNADYVDCANLDGSGGEEIVGDFGTTGLWVRNAGVWTQLSGVNADYVAFGNTNGSAGEELVGDFGATGLWQWSSGSGWLQLSGVNADFMVTGDVDNSGDDELFGDFAATGLWLWDSGTWTQLSGVDADFMIRANVDFDGPDELAVDFGVLGLWLRNASDWTQLSGVDAEYMMAGDFDGDNTDEVMADFGTLGLWLWDNDAWSQVSSSNPD